VGAYTADTGGSIYAIKKYNVGKSYVVFLPNTTYDLPAFDLLLESGPQICGVPVDDLSLGVA
jgi:hypothetical protein